MPHSESVLPLGVPIAPTEPTDGNSTHIAEYGRGGLHSVADLTARTNIATDRKRVGMLVWVESEQKYYRLSVLPDTWVEFATGGSGTVTSITPAADNGNGTAITTSGTISVVGTANEVTTSVTGTTVTVGLPDAITVVEVNADNADFNTAAAVADAVGRLRWDSAYSTLSLGLDADVQLKIGQGLYKLARNNSGGPIAKGEVVYVSGSHGGTQLEVSKASNASEVTSAETIGVAAEAIADNASGMVQTFGYLEGITTNGFAGAEGSPLYLGATAGTMQSNLPTQPAHGVRVGFLVKKAGGGAGSIFVNIQNYQEIEELSDFLKGTYADFDLMSYDLSAGVWRNRTVANALPTNSVALNKLAQIANNRLLGNSVGAAASPSAIAVSSPLGFNGVSGNLEFNAPGSNGQVYYRASGALATSGKLGWNDATATLTIADLAGEATNITPTAITGTQVSVSGTNTGDQFTSLPADVVLGRTTGTGAAQQITCTAAGRSLLDDADAAAQRTTLGLGTGDTPQFTGVTAGTFTLSPNGEFIRNTVDGRIDLMPAPHPSGDFGVYFDLTSSNFYAKVGTIDSAGTLNTNSGFQFDNTIAVIAGKSADFGNTGGLVTYWASGANPGAWHFAPFIGSGHAGSLILVSQSGNGSANRRPTTAHTDPTLYIYAAGSANASHYLRANHNGTNATIESGAGKAVVKAASVVRIEGPSGGFDLPATAGSNGQVLTTDGTNASWQTPTGGGGTAFDEVMRIAFIGI